MSMAAIKTRLKSLGRFDLGCRKVDLYGDPTSTGGSFDTAPDNGVAWIMVGLDHDDWKAVVGIAMHEAVELACAEMGLRYRPSPDHAGDSGGYVFQMKHADFAEAVARAGYFITPALPKLSAAYAVLKKGK